MAKSENQASADMSKLTPGDFLSRLSERVSGDNARLLLSSAMIRTGLHAADSKLPMAVADAKSLCLELIRVGGPAFQVGQALYREVH